ncbi:MAG: MG2 domain-containing protein, partial [Acidobacteriota bacterium]|nr:MG2 domain-containing protein [Acidobacteriota bacterium]
MSRRWFSLLLCLAVCLNSVPISAAAPSPLLRLNEADTKINFNSGGTSVTLTLENDAGRTIPARVRLEILDPQNRVRAAATRDESIRPGTNKLVAALAPSLTASLTNDQRRQLMLSRLRYRITPGAHEGTSPSPVAQSALPAAIEGYISLSQMIAPDVFELRVAAPQFARGGTDYHARARATHPLTARPVAGVSVAAEIKFEAGENDVTLKASGSTDAEGFAALAFVLPRRIAGNEGRIKVNAWHGDFRQEAEADIQLNNFANILVTTDKTLYQPGQELHMRALAFDATRRALANAPATLKITDPEGITVFRAPLQTSRFGVASADWPIPEGTRLGDYNLSIELGGAEYENSPQGYAAVRISRYELPNFVVNAKPDRVFYLPGQSAAVEVRADYLFGQPVTRGRVRVVREKERTWNYREQKWDIDEGEQHEGETDKNGRFTARLDFKEEFDDLLDDGDGEYAPRFRDLSYAAYFTDPTTNRTEQRRFDVRLTKEAIHIYVITGDGRQSSKLPLQFYVSTSYADGTPAADCEVQIRDEDEADADDETPGRLSAPVVRNVRTNKYGVAKVPGLRLQEQADEDDADLRLTARDGKGASGHRNENFDFWDRAIIRVETDKPFYRPGDPVKVRIEASEARMKVAVDVAREGRVIRSEMVQLHDGRASLVIPYTSDLKDEVAVSAYSLSEENFDRYDYPSAGRTILFPRDRDLKLDVELSRATYRPGEEALADFRVRAPDGRLIESALGVVVFDKAVEERARIDSDFSGGAGFSSLYRAWRGYGDTLAGVSRGELAKVDLKKPLPEGFDLVAEILLRESGYTPQLFGSDQFETNLSSVFNSLLTMQLNPLQSLLETSYAQQQIYPTNAEMLHRLLFPAGINFSDLRDPWGMPYRASFFVERETDVTAFICAGADKRFDTADDFTIARFARPYFRPLGEAINRAVARFNARTGQFVRDAATLKSELAREGIDLDAMRDPWGQPFQPGFGVNTKNYFINVRSGGPDQKIGNAETHDDVFVWNSSIDYTRLLKAEIDDALGRHFAATNNFPQTVAEFDDALARAGLNKGTLLRDGWDRPLYVTFRRDARYTDRVRIQSYASFGQPQQQKTEVTPITQHVNYLDLRSAGADGKEGTSDDFDIATFSRIVAEQTSKEQEPMPVAVQPISFSGMTGALIGTVTDPQGAVVPGATVEAKNNATAQIYKATSADDGKFYLRNLPIGMYQVTVSAAYFKNTIITDVPVKAGQFTPLDLTLDVGGVSETVTVMSSVAEATSTTTSHSLSAMQIEELPSNGRLPQNFFHLKPGASTTHGATSTPRLREYFPETLVWQPSVETDRQGRAQIRFKLADNITTWKMSVIGSTTDGEIGIAEREIQAFQPFFVEHDPPRVLTEGDEIALPVVVRNYLATPQQVALDIKPEDWFTMLGPTHKQMRVPAGDAVRETFDFRAIASVKEGKQRITAMAGDADDAIERGVHVHPDGAEIAHTAAGIFGDAAALAIDIPADALPNTARAELKIYPNLLAHVVESIEAIMSRPYGCGEQTISSAYPSLLVLRHYQRAGFAPDKLPPVALNAQRYLRLGYERLLSYRAADGGFSYWGRGDERADLALT